MLMAATNNDHVAHLTDYMLLGEGDGWILSEDGDGGDESFGSMLSALDGVTRPSPPLAVHQQQILPLRGSGRCSQGGSLLNEGTPTTASLAEALPTVLISASVHTPHLSGNIGALDCCHTHLVGPPPPLTTVAAFPHSHPHPCPHAVYTGSHTGGGAVAGIAFHHQCRQEIPPDAWRDDSINLIAEVREIEDYLLSYKLRTHDRSVLPLWNIAKRTMPSVLLTSWV